MLWRELDRETQVFELATTGGTVSNTGIASLTLGGGLGWLMGKHGLTINPRSAEVITADGTFRTVSAFFRVRPAPDRHRARRLGRRRPGPSPRRAALLPRLLSDLAGRGRGLPRREPSPVDRDRSRREVGGRAARTRDDEVRSPGVLAASWILLDRGANDAISSDVANRAAIARATRLSP